MPSIAATIPESAPVNETAELHSQVTGRASERFYHPELDVLRFFAFLAVFIHHSLSSDVAAYMQKGLPEWVAKWCAAAVLSGGLGVDLFFALSSYLITELLIREYLLRGKLDWRSFYVRRALRIWPLYYLFIAACVLIVPLFLVDSLSGWHLIAFLFFSANWSCAALGYPASVAAPLWSISVEEQFYASWPLLLSRIGINRIVHICIAMLIIAQVTRLLLWSLDAGHTAVWCNTFARLDPIAGGALLAACLRGNVPRLTNFMRISLLIVGGLLFVCAARFGNFYGAGSLFLYPAATIGAISVICAILRKQERGLRQSLIRRALIYLGRISYGLYVWHLLAIAITVKIASSKYPIPKPVLAFLITVLISICSYHVIERPFLRWKERFSYVRSRSS
jgi:peptidoglycan/LPS O-acetylase OafA/YrhL